MAAEPLLVAEGLCKSFGAVAAVREMSLAVAAGEIHALIGPNGAGKTTALAQLSGEMKPDAGRVVFQGRDITGLEIGAHVRLGIARSFQITCVLDDFSAEDNVAMAVQARASHNFRFWRPARRDSALRDPARAIMARVGLEDRAAVPARALSHGERRQLEVAMALAVKPKLLLLDEPMAGMGPDETRRMVALLASLKGEYTILMVEHDMDAVFALADRVTVLVYGQVIATGAPAAIRADAHVRRAYLGEDE